MSKVRTLCMVLSCMLVVVFSSAQPVVPQPSEESVEQYVELGLKTNKTRYVQGEPVILDILVKNISGEFIQFASVLSPTSDFEIMVYRPERFPFQYTGPFRIALYPRTIYKLDVGEKCTIRYILVYDEKGQDGFLTAEPGKMRLVTQMRYSINDRIGRMVNFPPIEFEIINSTGENQKAFDLLKNEDIAQELNKGEASKENLPVYNNVVEKYPRSVFAPYCLYSIAGYRMNDARPDNPTSESFVLQPMKKIMEKYPEFPLMDNVYYRHALYYYIYEQHEKARHWLAELYYKFPESPKVRRGDPLFQEYFFEEVPDYDMPVREERKDWLY